MKKLVVKGENRSHVDVKNVSTDMIYATWISEFGHTMIITKIHGSMETQFQTVWLYADMLPNYCYSSPDLKTLITEMIDDGIDVFEFECEQDMFEWITKKCR
jgi:hypothetical protein